MKTCRNFLLSLQVLCFVLQAHAAPAPKVIPLEFGKPAGGAITTPHKKPAYSIKAGAGDIVLIRIGRNAGAGSFWPKITLLDPQSLKITQAGFGGMSEITTKVKKTGVYQIIVDDAFGSGGQTGTFTLTAQRLNNPGNGIELDGKTVKGSISQPGQLISYLLPVAAGDVVYSRMGSVEGGNIWSEIRLYSPKGVLLGSNKQGSSTEVTATSPDAGKCLILVTDGFTGIGLGEYGFMAQRVNNPLNATPVAGSLVKSKIEVAGQGDTFTIPVHTGETVYARLARIAGPGSFWPHLRLYDPLGKLVGENSLGSATEITGHCQTTGKCVMIVSDGFNGGQMGEYGIIAQRIPDSEKALHFKGENIIGNLSESGQTDTYTIYAAKGDNLIGRMGKDSGDFWPSVRLYDPNGNLLKIQKFGGVATVEATAPGTGLYTFIVSDGWDGTKTGNYGLTLQNLSGPRGSTPLAPTVLQTGVISTGGHVNFYTFDGIAGNEVLVKMHITNGSMWAGVRVYDPTGKMLENKGLGGDTEITLPILITGRYLVGCMDNFGGSNTGNYQVGVLFKGNNKAPALSSMDIEKNELKPGGNSQGTVTLASAPSSDVVVSLLSSDPVNITVPSYVIIPQGSTSVKFDINARGFTTVSSDITATLGGVQKKDAVKLNADR